MRCFVLDICGVESSEEVSKNVLAKNFNLGWVRIFLGRILAWHVFHLFHADEIKKITAAIIKINRDVATLIVAT